MEAEFNSASKRREKDLAERRERLRQQEQARKRIQQEAQQRAALVDEQVRIRQEAVRKESEKDVGGIHFERTLRVVAEEEEGRLALKRLKSRMLNADKIILPPSCLEELTRQDAQYPVFFEIKNLKTGAITHGGVLEFVAQEDSVILPQKVIECLGLGNTAETKVRVRYVRLPKGSFARLQPLDGEFNQLRDQRSLLESYLRTHYATLTVGDILPIASVTSESRPIHLKVLELEPAEAVNIIDTELSVDIVSTENDMQTSESLTVGGPGVVGVVEAGSYFHCSVTVPQEVLTSVLDGSCSLDIDMEASEQTSNPDGADADLYVATEPIRKPTQNEHMWSAHDLHKKKIILTATDLQSREATALSPFVLFIGVYGFSGKVTFKLIVSSIPLVNSNEGQSHSLGFGSDSMSLSQSEVCPNCQQRVPSPSMALHTAFCVRHCIRCEQCGVVLRKEQRQTHCHCEKCGKAMSTTEREKHVSVFHTLLKCECGVELEMESLRVHKATDCPNRLVICRFCGEYVAVGDPSSAPVRDRYRGLTAHESYCGARTAPCEVCGRSIMLKDMTVHHKAVHPSVLSSAAESSVEENGVPSASTHPQTTPASTIPQVNCPVCDLSFPTEQALNVHLDADHFSVDATQEAPAAQTMDTTPLREDASWAERHFVKCPICGEKHKSERQLNVHIDAKHSFDTPSTSMEVDGDPKFSPCVNTPCGNVSTNAHNSNLCVRCYQIIIEPFSDQTARVAALMARYFSQLTQGCGLSECRNHYCRTHSPEMSSVDANTAAAISMQLVAKASALPAEYYVSVLPE
eukprot:GILK01008455.1.p1 GENE.GILK01008455.1~~GILK01008455.1.p1  ORF type:complete len:819 (-),score=103.13 GILK01008455.1:112-2520(-)